MKKRDIVIGLVVLFLLAGVIYWRQRIKTPDEEIKIPQTLSTEDKIEEKFRVQIPEGVDKAELKDVTGGTASGITTRKFEASTFELGILADLPTPEVGKFYQGWARKDDEFLALGELRIAKGGYLLDFKSGTDYSDYNKIVVSLEKSLTEKPDKTILEGSF